MGLKIDSQVDKLYKDKFQVHEVFFTNVYLNLFISYSESFQLTMKQETAGLFSNEEIAVQVEKFEFE